MSDASAGRKKKILLLIGLFAVLSVSAVLMVVPARQESQTYDEGVYVVGGLSYWKTNDFRLNIGQPPLLKELFALPLLIRGMKFNPNPELWATAEEWEVSRSVLFNNVLPGQELLLSGRIVNIVLALGLIVLAAAWAKKTWGRAAGIVSGLLVAFEPNVLAHGHLATTDVGYTLAILGSIFCFGRYLEQRTFKRLVIAALVAAIALTTRFNALLLMLILPVEYIVVRLTSGSTFSLSHQETRRTIAVFIIMIVSILWIVYGFEVRTLNQPQDVVAHKVLKDLGSAGELVASVPLPAASYLSGVLTQFGHNAYGHPAYLFGMTSHKGWWYYFPAAMLVKMTLASLLLALIGLVAACKNQKNASVQGVFSAWFLILPLVVLTGTSMLSNINLGVRYVLPSIVLVLVLAAAAVKSAGRWRIAKYLVIGIMVAFHIASVVRHFPHWLPYANEAFGGPTQLSHYLIDSNLDWNQDLPLLKQYLNDHGITEYRFQPFVPGLGFAYGLKETHIPTDQEIATTPFTGVIALGKSPLYYPGLPFAWLRKLQPTTVLGYSINVYDVR